MAKKSSAAIAAALGQLGTGLLQFGANRERLRFEQEREENLRRLQEAQLTMQRDNNTAQNAIAAERNTLTREQMELQASQIENENTYRQGLLTNNQATVDATNRRTDAEMVQAGFTWNDESEKWEIDEEAMAKFIERDAARWGGGSRSSWQTQYDTMLNTYRALRNEGAEGFAELSDAQLSQRVFDVMNTSKAPNPERMGMDAIRLELSDITKEMGGLDWFNRDDEYKQSRLARRDELSQILSSYSGGGGSNPSSFGFNPFTDFDPNRQY